MAFSRDRELPGPLDGLVGNIPIMCLRLDQRGNSTLDGAVQWTSEKLPYSPGTTTPEGAPYFLEPTMEQPEGFYAFSGGMGFRVQDPKRDRDTDGYYHAHYVDGAGDIIFNAPAVTKLTPSTTDTIFGINGFFISVVGGAKAIMSLGGRYCNRRTADNAAGWGNITKDFGAGANAIRGEIFRGTQTRQFAFVALKPPTNDTALAPTLATAAAGGTVADGTYGVKVVYTFANSQESLPSPAATQVTAGGGTSTLTITSPAAYSGATGWYAYVTQAGGSTYTRQQAAGSPTAIAANLVLTAPPTSGGVQPILNNYWAWDMATNTTVWTQHASLNALDFITYRGNQLWMLNMDSNGAYQIQVCTDGGTAPTWGGAFTICDASNPATNFEIHEDKLFVRTQKGLRAVNGVEDTAQEITGAAFKFVDTPQTNCRMASFLEWVITPMYRSLFSYDVNGNFEEIGLAVLRRNDSPVSGYPTALIPYGTWYVLVAFWNEANNTAYLMKWGNWKLYSTLFSPIPKREFVPSWLGALWEQSTKIQAMHISDVAGGPYMYFGDAAGDIGLYKLPRNGPDATGDTTWTTFNTDSPFDVYMPAITQGNQGIPKAVTGLELTGQNLDIAATYRTGRTGTYGNATTMQNNGVFTDDDPGDRKNFLQSIVSRWVDIRLQGTATSASVPCILESLALYVAPRPPFKFVHTFKMLIGSRVLNKKLSVIKDWDTPTWIQGFVSLCETGPISCVSPWGTSFLGLVTNFKLEPFYSDVKETDIEFIGTVQIMQHIPTQQQGEHIHLANYSHASLDAYSHQGLTVL